MAGDFVVLKPISGKFISIPIEGITLEIYEEGTKVDYNLAVKLLSIQPSLVCVIPKIVNGKFLTSIKPADQARISEAQANHVPGKIYVAPETASDADPAIQKVLESQNKTIESLIESNKELSSKLEQALAASPGPVTPSPDFGEGA
jgi:hypothetical protein